MSLVSIAKACFLTLAAAAPAAVIGSIVGALLGFVSVDAAASVFVFYLQSGFGLVCVVSFFTWLMLDSVTR